MKNKLLYFKDKSILIAFLCMLLLIIFLPILLIGRNTTNKSNINDSKGTVIKETYTGVNGQVGKIKVYISSKDKIVELDMEEYIKGVVASEMPANFNIEALKAQAVASRTFAINKIKYKCNNAKGADVCDQVDCQVYTSKEEKINDWGNGGHKNWDKIEEAVKSTKGQYIYYDGKIVSNAQYFAVSWGKTESCKEVFGEEQPYLKSVNSSGDSLAPKYNTSININNDTFVTKVNNYYKNAKLKNNIISSNVKIISRNESGSVKTIKIGQQNVSGVEFRKLFDLNSTNFTLTFNKGYIIIKCLGYGHGVGMSQWGANYMANEGRGYKEILKHYYSGIEVK